MNKINSISIPTSEKIDKLLLYTQKQNSISEQNKIYMLENDKNNCQILLKDETINLDANNSSDIKHRIEKLNSDIQSIIPILKSCRCEINNIKTKIQEIKKKKI